MKYRQRIYYSDSQKAQMWECWQKGQSQQQIAQLFDRNHSSIQRILAEPGGIIPRQRCRSERALSLAEREEISRGVAAGKSIRSIAVALNRAPSTISRELQRNQGRQRYRAAQADQVPGIGRCDPSRVSWRCIGSWRLRSPQSSADNGHPSKSPAGSNACIQMTRGSRAPVTCLSKCTGR